MLKKLLSTLGVGGASVNLELHNDKVRAGEMLKGVLQITPGTINQRVDAVIFCLVAQSRLDDRSVTVEVGRQKMSEDFDVAAGSRPFSIPISYHIPPRCPISTSFTRLSLTTVLDSDAIIDPGDTDRITVLPEPRVQVIMDAFQDLGFVENHRDSGRFNGRWQEFEYVPMGSSARHIKELDVIYDVRPDGVMLLAEVERRSLLLNILNLEELAEQRMRILLPNHLLHDSKAVASELSRKLISSL